MWKKFGAMDVNGRQGDALAELQAILSYVEGVYRAVLNRPPELAEAEKYSNAIRQGLSPIDFFQLINGSRERLSHAKLFAVPGSYQSPVANPAELRSTSGVCPTSDRICPALPSIAPP